MRFCLFSDSSVLRTKDRWKNRTLLQDPQFPSVSEHCTSLSSSIPPGAPGRTVASSPRGSPCPVCHGLPHCRKCCLLSCLVSQHPEAPLFPPAFSSRETPTLGQLRKYTHISQRHRFSFSSCHKGNITISKSVSQCL